MSIALPLIALTLAGLYFPHEYKTTEQKQRIKANLKRESLYLSEKTNQLLSLISKELKEIAKNQALPEKSLFAAVALKDSINSSMYEILLPPPPIQKEEKSSLSETKDNTSPETKSNIFPNTKNNASPKTQESFLPEIKNNIASLSENAENPDSETQTEEAEGDSLTETKKLFQKLAARLPEKRKQKIWIQDISPSKENKIIVFLWNASTKKTAAGFIQEENLKQILPFLDFTDKEANEVFLSTSQGWLLFHTKKRNLFGRISPSSPLSKILSKSKAQFISWKSNKQRKKKIAKKDSPSALSDYKNLAYILPLKGSNLSIIAKTSFKKPAFALTEWEWGWISLSLAVLVFLLSLLFLILSPLFTAYTQLKRALSLYSIKGELPFIPSHNRFLRFYSNVWNASQSKKQEMEKETLTDEMEERLTFRSILESVHERLKERYPGLFIQQIFKVNVSLGYFAPLMKKILSALLLNAIEAMGGSQKQNITIKTWEEEGCFVFTVEDKGQGLTGESAAKAFNLYYSTKSQLGVGLNLAESLVIANKGSLELLPGEGAGAKALIRLPMSCFLKTEVFSKSIPFKEKRLKNFEIKEEAVLSAKHKRYI